MNTDKFEFGYYSLRRNDVNGLEYGLPFIALTDADAKAMVYKWSLKDVDKIDPMNFVLYRLGKFRPTNDRPLVLCKREPVKVCTFGDILADLGNVVKVGEDNE